ncbi:hypothetical protein ACIHIX_34690 [Streptomyces sp. NPDC051913]|uniref:hypothetical protein n=1 Tax=Streptomyces sp. NPDC051913 TaxID=3365676 RepID=UPI0037CD5AD9
MTGSKPWAAITSCRFAPFDIIIGNGVSTVTAVAHDGQFAVVPYRPRPLEFVSGSSTRGIPASNGPNHVGQPTSPCRIS